MCETIKNVLLKLQQWIFSLENGLFGTGRKGGAVRRKSIVKGKKKWFLFKIHRYHIKHRKHQIWYLYLIMVQLWSNYGPIMVQLWSNYGPIMVQQVLKMLFCLTKQQKAFFFLFFFRKLFFTKILIWSRVYSRFDNWHWWSPHQRCYRQYTQVFHDTWQLRDNILRYSTIHDRSETIYSGIPRYRTT